MKEFIDKLIARLEDRKKYCEMCHEEFPNAKMSLTYEVQINAYKNAIEIVNQLAEECKGGWIPCSEKLPEEYCHCLVTYESKYNTGIREDVYLEVEGEWDWQSKFEGMRDNVIAWQPLPAPYQPKGE